MESKNFRQPSNGSLHEDPAADPGESAMELAWTFGFNKDIVGGVHNLSDSSRNSIFFASAHTGVIYDYVTRQQRLLQGHSNAITCCKVSDDKRWAVTADCGPDSMIVVWNTVTGDPVRTIVEPHPNGIVSLDISADGAYIAALSAPPGCTSENSPTQRLKGKEQQISIWEWGSKSPNAICVGNIDQDDLQVCVRFNASNDREVVTNGKSRVIFWDWSLNKFCSHSPPLSVKDFRQKVGNFTQSLFIPETTQAITATVDGDIVLWDRTLAGARECLDSENEAVLAAGRDKRAVKIVKLSNNHAIHFLAIEGNLLVTGGADGSVRFYDTYFRIIAWFEDLHTGPVLSVSFASTVPTTCTTINGTFSAPDFVVATSKARIVSVESSAFQELSADNRRGTSIVRGFDSPLAALCMHPSTCLVFTVLVNGTIQAWDYEAKRQVGTKLLRKEEVPTCMAMDAQGRFLVVGCHNGTLRILRWGEKADFGELACFCIHVGVGITQLKVSPDGDFLALADTEHCVSLYRFETPLHPKKGTPLDINQLPVDKGKAAGQPGPGLEPSDGEARAGWTYIGRHRSHRAAITGLDFAELTVLAAEEEGDQVHFQRHQREDEEVQREVSLSLISVSEDRTMVEYDVENSSVTQGVVVRKGSPVRIETGVLPTTCLFHAGLGDENERFFITTNDEYKVRSWNTATKQLRQTCLGPTFGGPLNSLLVVPSSPSAGEDSKRPCYVAYSTPEKVVGLMQFPFDGNPFKSIGVVAHPSTISGMGVSHKGDYLVTGGSADLALNLWTVRSGALDGAVAAAGEGVEPFLGLLEGGASGELYNQIIEYFYYTQLRSQGENSTSPRLVKGTIPVDTIPEIVRALGYYPTEQEAENMKSEVRYARFTETGTTAETINLGDFVRLYLNHRPVYGVSIEQIEGALRTIQQYRCKAQGGVLPLRFQDLIAAMEGSGDRIDLNEHLPYLIEDGGIQLTDIMDAPTVSCKLLGFEDPEVVEQESKETVE